MANTEEDIKNEIKNHMRKYGGSLLDWYVGITSDPESRLFGEHKVDKNKNSWLYIQTNDETARNVGHYFVNYLGTDGKANGVEHSSYVYIYRKTWRTKP
ncbi:MAG: hypothetical protein JW983_00110 [Elusimicrobia bacterium]|nr:hypothetical protein [Elusimicrobiota bacterium]